MGLQSICSRILPVLLLAVHLATGQLGQTCAAGETCILLRDCPALLTLIRTGQQENIRRVREAICGFQGRNSLVCCRRTGGIEENPSNVPIGENLLPSGNCGRPKTDDKIFGGSTAPIGAYPWMAAMGYTETGIPGIKFLCAGSLITSRYVLTAAHCLDEKELGLRRLAVIHLGDWDVTTEEDCQVTNRGTVCSPPHITAGAEEITVHPEYDVRARSSDDIALIRLNITIDFATVTANVEPICLPNSGLNVRAVARDRLAVATGWGFTEHGNQSDVLLEVNLPFAENQVCRNRYGSRFLSKQLCIGGIGGKDTCAGDSGAPLILPGPFGPPYLQIGLVSYGSLPCAINRVPAVYTSVSDYRDWIVRSLKP